MSESPPAAEVATIPPEAEVALPPGVQPSRNYAQAVELGVILARSGYFEDARDPAQAAVRVMIGMDLGLSPTASLMGIHAFGEGGRTVFVIEGKLLAALIKGRDGYDYRITERTQDKVSITFVRDGVDLEPVIDWTLEDAQRAGLTGKENWVKFPREMLTWRALVEGTRIHFPEILVGQPLYTEAEFEPDELRDAIAGPKAQPLTDDEAEQLRERARVVFEELNALEPVIKRGKRMARPLLETRIREAEHSHANLRSVVASLTDLLRSERRVVELEGELDERFDGADLKAAVARGERFTSNRERIEFYSGMIGDFDATVGEDEEPEGGDDDGGEPKSD
jgi:hypothetical protein